MAMMVDNKIVNNNLQNILSRNNALLQKNLQQVMTGLRIIGAADNTSDYLTAERLRTQLRALNQSNQNVRNDSALIQAAFGGGDKIIEDIRSLRAMAANAANDFIADDDRRTIQRQVNQLVTQIDEDTSNVRFNDRILLNGSANLKTPVTATVMTNSALATSTTRTTALTDLKNRQGQSLGIESSDTITASYVKNARVYTTTFTAGQTTIEGMFRKLNHIDTATFGNPDYESIVVEADDLTEPVLPSDEDLKDSIYTLQSELSILAGEHTDLANDELNFILSDWPDAMLAKQSDGTYKNFSDWTQIDSWQTLSDSSKTNLNSLLGRGSLTDALDDYSQLLNQYNAALARYNEDMTTYFEDRAIGNIIQFDAGNLTVSALQRGVRDQISGVAITVTDSGGRTRLNATDALNSFRTTTFATDALDDTALRFQTGGTGQSISAALSDLRAEMLGLRGSNGSIVSVSTKTAAQAAINVFDNALQRAIDHTATVWAMATRLEYADDNLHVASENIKAANSTISDADTSKAAGDYVEANLNMKLAQRMFDHANAILAQTNDVSNYQPDSDDEEQTQSPRPTSVRFVSPFRQGATDDEIQRNKVLKPLVTVKPIVTPTHWG